MIEFNKICFIQPNHYFSCEVFSEEKIQQLELFTRSSELVQNKLRIVKLYIQVDKAQTHAQKLWERDMLNYLRQTVALCLVQTSI